MALANIRTHRITSKAALTGVIAVASLAALVLILYKPFFGDGLINSLGEESFKLLLQFVLITVIGGGVFAYLSTRRDEQMRVETDIKDLQALSRELGEARRAMKRSKRKMRAMLRREVNGALRIGRKEFESALDEVQDAQIQIEQIRQHIGDRSDLFEPEASLRIALALRYSARYMHDVYEDHEKGKVRQDGDDFVVDDKSSNLLDFLMGTRTSKEALGLQDEGPLDARFTALEVIEKARKTSSRQRYSKVVTECFRAVMAQVQETTATKRRKAGQSH